MSLLSKINKSLIQIMLWGGGILLAVYLTGFVFFAEGRRADAVRFGRPPQADGIVVLTGTAQARIEEGLRLIAGKHGRRLLITGVHKKLDMDDILNMSEIDKESIKCCIDLDYHAYNTAGNAVEAYRWARILGYRSLILVTSTHHIPRTLIEMRRVMPNIRLIPHAVNPQGIRLEEWWQYPGTLKLLLGEYTRYLFALFNLTGAQENNRQNNK